MSSNGKTNAVKIEQHAPPVPDEAQTRSRCMTIVVMDVTCKKTRLQVAAADTVESLKAKYMADEGAPADAQLLIFAFKPLEDGRTLAYYNIHDESQLHLIRPYLRAGARLHLTASAPTVAMVSAAVAPLTDPCLCQLIYAPRAAGVGLRGSSY